MGKCKILVVGSSNTDLIIKAANIPKPGETVLGGKFRTFPGGKGANQAVAAARAGGEVDFIAAVGDDNYGDEALAGYKADGINASNIKICKGVPSGIAMISVGESGENAIAVAPGANSMLSSGDLEEAEEAFSEAGIMLIQMEIPIETIQTAIQLCGECNTKVLLNPAPPVNLKDAILCGVEVISPNEIEAEILTGIKVDSEVNASWAAEVLHEKGIPTVVITMGARGVYLSDKETELQKLIPGFPVGAEDTTAAGDWRHAGAVVTCLPDSTIIVLRVADNHPLNLQPGDVILGYNGVKWIDLLNELMEAELPIYPATGDASLW